MAEAAAVLGLISAIVQLVDFGTQILERLNEFHSATKEVPETFRALTMQLPLLLHTLQSVQAQADAGQISDEAASKLKSVVDSSTDLTDKLNKILGKVLPGNNASSFEKGLLALKSLAQDTKVLKLVEKLRSNIQMLILYQTTYQIDVTVKYRQELNHTHCLSALYTSDYESHRRSHPTRIRGTCTWFLDHPKYLHWRRQSSPSFLWLSADAGCGKSVISSLLVDELNSTRSQTELPAIICHFFFKDDEDAILALQAILHQLFLHNPSSIKHAMVEYEAKKEKFANEFDSLWKIFLDIIRDPHCRQVICVIDALDECKPSTRGRFLDLLADLCLDSSIVMSHPIKLFVTSRPYPSIERGFWKVGDGRLRGDSESELSGITHDINLVIEARVNKVSTDRSLSNEQRCSLQKTLIEKADKTFMWVSLVLNMIEDRPSLSRRALNEMLSTIPSSLEATYEKILSHIKQDEMHAARKVLQIMLAAVEPLNLEQMNAAFSLGEQDTAWETIDFESPIEGYIKNLLPSIVKVVGSQFYFVHHTAKEYLSKQGGMTSAPLMWNHSIALPDAHFLLANCCIKYLKLSDFQGRGSPYSLREMPWDDSGYGCEEDNWPSENSEEATELSDVNSGAGLEIDEAVDRHKATEDAKGISSRETDLRSGDIEQTDVARTPPRANSKAESEDLDMPFDESKHWMRILDIKEPRQVPFLMYAAQNWSLHVLEAYASGLRPDRTFDASALELCDSNHPSFRAWYEIWHFRDSFDQFDFPRTHGLHLAAYLGLSSVVSLIIDQEMDLQVQDDEGNTALHCAIRSAIKGRSRTSVIQLLLDHGLDPNIQNRNRDTALHIALSEGELDPQENIFKQVLASRPKLDIFGHADLTLVVCAVIGGHLSILQMLLEHGASADLPDERNEAALFHAVRRGEVQIVRVLLDAGADMERLNFSGLTPLVEGLRTYLNLFGEREVVGIQQCSQLLVERGGKLPHELIQDFEEDVNHPMQDEKQLLRWLFAPDRQSRLPHFKGFFLAKGWVDLTLWES